MINKHLNIILFIVSIVFAMFVISCDKSDNVDYKAPDIELSNHPNDIYIRENILNEYGTAIRWEWDQRFLNKGQTAEPVNEELVIPIVNLVEELWIKPFMVLSADSEKFIRNYMPKEVVFIGSYIYNSNGTNLLGYAESGARISLMNLNAYDLNDRMWLEELLITMHHEFAHIVHQNHDMPIGYGKISPLGYLGEGWRNGISLPEAIKRGMVTAYGTSNQYEDFTELISRFLIQDTVSFNSTYLRNEDCAQLSNSESCIETNNGRELIRQKLKLIKEFYDEEFSIDLNSLRDTIQKRMSLYEYN
ncbi:MAG: putative zinc-binding metallopeptidase [Marinifilum sp.]|jgi:substrate import-associated zinc metallohydrolase lipoprotein|nr:putative zinc-binding metallopeptidase [Marinifilum sp.]